MKKIVFSSLLTVSYLLLISANTVMAADYSHGDACTTQGAFHQTNDATGLDLLVCDGAFWRLALRFDSAGNTLRMDDDPSSGNAGCLRYNGTSSVLEFSNDCTNYNVLTSLWRDDGAGGPAEIYYSTGNVGINTTDPSYTLDVNGNLRATTIRDSAAPTTSYISQGSGSNITDIYVNGVLYARFNGASHVTDIGTSSSSDPAAIRIGWNDLLYIDNTNQRIGIRDNTPDAELDVVGDINYTGVLVDVSDARLKTNIQALHNSLEKLRGLKPVSFVMKDDPEKRVELGFLAQNVEEYFPELVQNDGEYKSLNYSGLIAPLVQAVQEKHTENEQLKAKNVKLEQSLQLIEERLKILETEQLADE